MKVTLFLEGEKLEAALQWTDAHSKDLQAEDDGSAYLCTTTAEDKTELIKERYNENLNSPSSLFGDDLQVIVYNKKQSVLFSSLVEMEMTMDRIRALMGDKFPDLLAEDEEEE